MRSRCEHGHQCLPSGAVQLPSPPICTHCPTSFHYSPSRRTTQACAKRLHSLLASELSNTSPRLLTDALSPRERTAAIDALTDGASELLVSTDLASRGLDFPNVTHVVMFDLVCVLA